MADARHPLISAHRLYALAHLVRERLKAQAVVSGGESAGESGAGAVLFLRMQQNFDRLFETAFENADGCGERNQAIQLHARFHGQMEAMNGVKEEVRAHAPIKIALVSAEVIQLLRFFQQRGGIGAARERIQRTIADFGVFRADDVYQSAHSACPLRLSKFCTANASRICDSTSTRSRPLKARATCARSNPYRTPTS